MSSHDRQPDLFAEPRSVETSERPLRPPYTLAELEALDRQLRAFDRIPDEWCAGWWEMVDRAHDTIRQTPKEQRSAIRAVFFEQADRLLRVESAEEAAQALAEAKSRPAKPSRGPKRQRS